MLDKFFNPKSVAVFGASRSLDKPGRVVLRNLVYGGFEGKVYPVNPNTEEIDHLKSYSPGDVPKSDLGVFVIPAPLVPKALEESRDRLKAALVMSGGFGEAGNVELDRQLLEAADGVPILGPNCLGVLNTHNSLGATFIPSSRLPLPPAGKGT